MEAFVETQKAHETVRQAENREILREHRDEVEAIAVALLTRDVATELAAVATYNALKARVRANPSVFYEGHSWMRMGFLSETGEKSAPALYLMLAQGRSMALKAELEAEGVVFPPAPEYNSALEVSYGAAFTRTATPA